ncbi:hypothetical protein MMC22_008069 [Lobaria immixta]|nr:hypothetical protein [Lobaria immixta]
MSLKGPSRIWRPAQFTRGEAMLDTMLPKSCAVVILNQPLENKDLLVGVCGTKAKVIVCGDGGANRLFDLGLKGEEENTCHPQAICGDMDSLRPAVEKHYRERGTRIIKDPDQYSTDLAKCLKYINDMAKFWLVDYSSDRNGSETSQTLRPDVAIFGSLGGRADQAFSQLHQLYAASDDKFTMLGDLYLITREGIMFVLEKGRNSILAPVKAQCLTKNIGIIPLGRPSRITTHGLEYDVTDWQTEIGTRVSTSNYIVNTVIEVETTEKVLFTVEMEGTDGVDRKGEDVTESSASHVNE